MKKSIYIYFSDAIPISFINQQNNTIQQNNQQNNNNDKDRDMETAMLSTSQGHQHRTQTSRYAAEFEEVIIFDSMWLFINYFFIKLELLGTGGFASVVKVI